MIHQGPNPSSEPNPSPTWKGINIRSKKGTPQSKVYDAAISLGQGGKKYKVGTFDNLPEAVLAFAAAYYGVKSAHAREKESSLKRAKKEEKLVKQTPSKRPKTTADTNMAAIDVRRGRPGIAHARQARGAPPPIAGPKPGWNCKGCNVPCETRQQLREHGKVCVFKPTGHP